MSERLLICNGRVIDPTQKLDAVKDILIKDGKIAQVAAGLAKKKEFSQIPAIDASDCWVTPGLIDMHVHLREPGSGDDETIASGSRAAAAGGFTTVLAMPNTQPPIDSAALLGLVQAKAKADAQVNVLFAAAATLGQKGEHLTEILKLAQMGAAALSDDGRPIMNAELMRRAMEYAKDCDLVVIDHCEDENLSACAPLNEGVTAAALGMRGTPWAAETVMVLRDIALSELTGSRIHIAHVSAAQSVQAVREAKKRGVAVTAEASPHHFTLTEDSIKGYDADFKMNPPLRSAFDRAAILEGLSDGTIDAIASDHAPHSPAKKSAGLLAAPCGVIGLETSLALALTHLVAKKIISPKRLVDLMSAGPARILGLKKKGTLKPGSDADITVIDPASSWTVEEPFASKSRNCPFLGAKLKGRAQATIVGGQVRYSL
jgi:dihydroorotase